MTKPHCTNPRARAEIRQRTASVERAERQESRRIRPRSAGAVLAEQGSDGERALETHLRQRRFPLWIREFPFDAARRWRFDFAWPEYLAAIEVEGGSWISGSRSHAGGTRFEQDCIKYAEAAIQGWLVLRVTTAMVDDGRAITLAGRLLWTASQRRTT